MTPWGIRYYSNLNSHIAYNFSVKQNGNIADNKAYTVAVDGNLGVRPVINLKANTQFTGSGTSTDPYTVVS